LEVVVRDRLALIGLTKLINNGATFFYSRIVSLQDQRATPRQLSPKPNQLRSD
jgi:hypothetical protein